jgi:hypothetical protein
MALRRTARLVIGAAVIAGAIGLIAVGRRQWLIADIANRNINKQTCSCVFVGRRSLDACIADIPPAERLHLRWVRFRLDTVPGQEALTNTMFGIIGSTAKYEPGTGCTQY